MTGLSKRGRPEGRPTIGGPDGSRELSIILPLRHLDAIPGLLRPGETQARFIRTAVAHLIELRSHTETG